MKKSNVFVETFKDVRVKIAAGIITALVILLGVAYLVNPAAFKNIFGFSGVGLMGDYIVNENVNDLPVYYSIADLNTGDTSKAGRMLTENELFGLDGFVNEQGRNDQNGIYAKVNFYNGEGGLARSWVGYITRVQLETLTHTDGTTPPPVTTYVVTFNTDGGTPVASLTVADGSKITEPTSTKTGFSLTGWEFQPPYNCPAGQNCAAVMPAKRNWNFATDTVTSNVTLTAKWSAIIVENPAPVITSVTGNPTAWVNSDVTLTVSATSIVPLADKAYSFDNGTTWQTANTATFNSNKTVQVVVKSASGRLSAVKTIAINRIDKTAPVCTAAGGSSSWFNTTRTITGTCSDNESGCKENVSKVISAETNDSYSPGTVTDNAGNSAVCASQLVKIDKTGPVISLSDNSTGTASNPACAVENSVANPVVVTVSDAGSGIDYSKRRWADTGSWAEWGSNNTSASYTSTASAPGDRQLQIEAYDKLGNKTVRTSGHYYLEGPIVSIYDSSRSYPVGSGSLKVYYKCEAWHSLSKNCDSKFSTSIGSELVYNNLSANIISNSGSLIKKHTTVSWSSSFQHFWVRSSNSYCATSKKGYKIARVFD